MSAATELKDNGKLAKTRRQTNAFLVQLLIIQTANMNVPETSDQVSNHSTLGESNTIFSKALTVKSFHSFTEIAIKVVQ